MSAPGYIFVSSHKSKDVVTVTSSTPVTIETGIHSLKASACYFFHADYRHSFCVIHIALQFDG